ncbi:MAG: leucine-rich repeat domain-containing protein [Lachnospiraceae bacterium]|nr:leucine-rich repeat domain-containing protein [Lachnospiraceae bacterium]
MKRTLCIIAAALLMVGALSILLVAPGTSEAESSMTIEDGVLVRYAISNNDTSVNIPATVREIGDEVFMNAKSLEAIGIPSSVKKIGKRAFYGCSGLTHVTIQNGTESIGESAFAMCSRLSLLSLPTTLTEVGDGAFAGDVALDSVILATPNPYFFLNENVLYNMNSTRLVSYIAGRTDADFVMPVSVKTIQPYAFWGSEHMKSAYVSNGVETIESFAFCNAAGLESIYIPNSVKSIEAYAFRDCRNLKYVAIENGACDIDPAAFDGCAEGLEPEFDVNKSAFRTNAGRFAVKKTASGNKIVSGNEAKKINNKKNGAEEAKTESDKNGDTESASSSVSGNGKSVGTVENGGSLVVNSVWGTKAPYKPVDREHPKGIVGAGKIVGGSVFIIPTDNYNTFSSNEKNTGKSTVSYNVTYER